MQINPLYFLPLLLVHFADRPDLNDWVSHLRAGNGAMCCDFTEAEHLTDVEWDTKDGHYRVYLDGHWIDVPDRAVVTVPNKYGPAVVWPSRYDGKVIDIRCFLPGTLS